MSSQDAAVFRVTISYNFHQMWKKAADVVLNKIANRRIASAERIPDEFYSVEYVRIILSRFILPPRAFFTSSIIPVEQADR